LEALADWLVEQGVTLAGMESTATCRKPVFYALEDRMGAWLSNAAHMNTVPGRKSDVWDAEWIAQLLEHPPVTRPRRTCRRRRFAGCGNLTRYRVQLMGIDPGCGAAAEADPERRSIKLSAVAQASKECG
jgi:transposase